MGAIRIGTKGIGVEFLGDVGDTVSAQDVQGKAAKLGNTGRLGSNAAGVLAEGDIANVVIAMLHAPMTTDRLAKGFGVQCRLAHVEAGFVGREPKPGLGVLMPGQAFNAGGANDQIVPLRIELSFENRRSRRSDTPVGHDA
jgi:hypothetical protein